MEKMKKIIFFLQKKKGFWKKMENNTCKQMRNIRLR